MTTAGVAIEGLLSSLATSMAKLARAEIPDDPVYDSVTQRSYNHLVLRTLLHEGYTVPRSVPHMVDLITGKPAREWLPGSDSDAVLVDAETRHPTQECLELIVDFFDPLGEHFENDKLDAVFHACRNSNSPDSYVAFRRLLTAKPAMTAVEMHREFSDLLLEPVLEVLKTCYFPAPASLEEDGHFAVCAGCKCLLTPVPGRGWRCDLDRCRGRKSARIGRELDARADGGVYYLQYPLRSFVTGPGLYELELERRLSRLGVEIQMWPGYDACDLLVVLPDGRRWAVDVKDYANPTVLGRRFKSFKSEPRHDQAFLVVPDYRFRGRDYAEAFASAREQRYPGAEPIVPVKLNAFVGEVEHALAIAKIRGLQEGAGDAGRR